MTIRKAQPAGAKRKSNPTTIALGAGAGIVTVAGATIASMAVLEDDDLMDVFQYAAAEPEETFDDDDNIAVDDANQPKHQPQHHHHHHHYHDSHHTASVDPDDQIYIVGAPRVDVQQGRVVMDNTDPDESGEPLSVETDPDVASLANDDQIDSGSGAELTAVGWRYMTDDHGNRMKVMLFQDEDGNDVVIAESTPGSGIYDVYVNPYTGEVVDDMIYAASYTSSDFEDMLQDDGGYLAPNDNDYHYAYNPEINRDIINTDNGELIAVVDRPGAGAQQGPGNPSIVMAQLDDDVDAGVVIDDDDDVVVRVLGADDGDVNASYVEIDYDNGIDQDVNVVNVDSVGSHVVGNDSVASGNDYIGSDIPEAQAVASAPVETHDSVHDYAESNISYDDGGADSFDADDIALDA